MLSSYELKFYILLIKGPGPFIIIIMNCLSLVVFFALKSDIIKAVSAFFLSVFVWSNFLHSFAFNFNISTQDNGSLLNSNVKTISVSTLNLSLHCFLASIVPAGSVAPLKVYAADRSLHSRNKCSQIKLLFLLDRDYELPVQNPKHKLNL